MLDWMNNHAGWGILLCDREIGRETAMEKGLCKWPGFILWYPAIASLKTKYALWVLFHTPTHEYLGVLYQKKQHKTFTHTNMGIDR